MTQTYEPKMRGQITRFEAGVIYKAVKTGKVKAMPEFTKDLYNQCDEPYYLAKDRYNRYGRDYDMIANAVRAILEENYEEAQEKINAYQKEQITHATKKSIYFGKSF